MTDKSNYYNHAAAAFATGAAFKSTAGIRQSITAGLLLASSVAAVGFVEEIQK